jgi:hypothetical protein
MIPPTETMGSTGPGRRPVNRRRHYQRPAVRSRYSAVASSRRSRMTVS